MRSSTSRPRHAPSSLEVLDPDEISALEEIHASILDSHVFVGLAHELDHNEQWEDQVIVLLRVANESLSEAHTRVRALVRLLYRRRRRAEPRSR